MKQNTNPTRRPRAFPFAVASILSLAGCGGATGQDEIAKQVEIAKQAADRAVAAQHAAEAAAGARSAGTTMAGSGFRKEAGEEPKFGAPTDGSKSAPADSDTPVAASDSGPPPPGSLPPPGA